MINWKIYYSETETYTGNPYNAPAFGVQVIVHADKEHGKYLVINHDYYWYMEEDDRWEGGDIVGLIDHLAQPGYKKVVFGRIITNKEFEKIYKTALLDSDFEPKTAYSYREKIPK